MTWNGEAANLTGLLAFVMMSILAVTSIPSVGEALNWAEWTCIQSKLGYVVVLFSLGHVCVVSKLWLKYDFFSASLWKSRKWLSALLPIIVLFLKLVFSIPPLSGYLRKIRRGWERGVNLKNHGEFSNVNYTGSTVVQMELEQKNLKAVKSM